MKKITQFVKSWYGRPLAYGLFWSGVGGMAMSVIMLLVSLAASSLLPPAEFGYYTSIISLASGLSAFMLLGSNLSCVRFICDPKNQKSQGSWLSASTFLVAIQVLMVAGIIVALRIHTQIWLVILVCGLLSFRDLADSLLRSFNLFVKQSAARMAAAAVTLGIFIFLASRARLNGFGLVEVNIAGMGFFLVIAGVFLKQKFNRFSLVQLAEIIRYNFFLTLNSISGFITGIEKFIIGSSVGLVALGRYSIYYSLSFLVLSSFGSMLMNAYWPYMVSKGQNLNQVRRRQNRWLSYLIPGWIICCSGGLLAYKLWWPGAYQISYLLIVSMAMASAAAFVYSVSVSLLNVNQIKISALLNIITYGVGSIFILWVKDITKYTGFQIILFSVMTAVANHLVRSREPSGNT